MQKNSSQKPVAFPPGVTRSPNWKPTNRYAVKCQQATTASCRDSNPRIRTLPVPTLHKGQASRRNLRRSRQGQNKAGERGSQPAPRFACPLGRSRCSAPRAEPAAEFAPIQSARASLPNPEGHVTPRRSVYFLAGAFAFAGAAFAFGAGAFFTAGLVAAAAAFAAGFAAALAAGFAAAFAGAAFLAAGFAAGLAAGFLAGAAFAAGFAGAAFFTAGFATALAAAGFLAGAALAAGFDAALAGAAFFTAVAAFAATAFAGAFFAGALDAGALDAGALDDCLAMSCPFTLCRWP